MAKEKETKEKETKDKDPKEKVTKEKTAKPKKLGLFLSVLNKIFHIRGG